MLTTNDVAKVYDTILSIPGMNETVKIDLKISRNDVSLVNNVIEPGLPVMGADDKSSNLFDVIPKENITANVCIR